MPMCFFFLQFISTMKNIIVYSIWHFSISDTFYIFSAYKGKGRDHRWRMEDIKRSQMKMGWKTDKNLDFKILLDTEFKVKIIKKTLILKRPPISYYCYY